jgi:hypothetical protein
MELSREFVERLSEILFNEEMNGSQMEGRLSEIFFNEKMMDNIPHDKHID